MVLKILADENIPQAVDLFEAFGEVRLMSGRDIDSSCLADVDVLLVRSVTRVDEFLLKGCPVKFVGSATIGSDHIDHKYLHDAGIVFANAPGSNANSVAEYVLSAILVLSERHGFSLKDKTLGIVGYGNVGRRLKSLMNRLAMACLVNDPILESSSDDNSIVWSDFDEVLKADIISLHVPLSDAGAYPTFHMINEPVLALLPKETMLINTSRGAVIDNMALKKSLRNNHRPVVLDVWENEPNIDAELLGLIDIATPHIAGYSAQGKRNGVIEIYKAFCNWLERPCEVCADLSEADVIEVTLNGDDDCAMLRDAVYAAYDVREDDRLLREVFQGDAIEHGSRFDRLRKHYRRRQEFSAFRVSTEKKVLSERLKQLGFVV